MLLYMVREALNGMWFMQQFSPGYSALMPFMLVDGKRTIGQVWEETNNFGKLLLSPDSKFIDGQIVD